MINADIRQKDTSAGDAVGHPLNRSNDNSQPARGGRFPLELQRGRKSKDPRNEKPDNRPPENCGRNPIRDPDEPDNSPPGPPRT